MLYFCCRLAFEVFCPWSSIFLLCWIFFAFSDGYPWLVHLVKSGVCNFFLSWVLESVVCLSWLLAFGVSRCFSNCYLVNLLWTQWVVLFSFSWICHPLCYYRLSGSLHSSFHLIKKSFLPLLKKKKLSYHYQIFWMLRCLTISFNNSLNHYNYFHQLQTILGWHGWKGWMKYDEM